MSDTALVTGASSGIGEATAEMLMEEGYEVYGIGRDFNHCRLTGSLFHPVVLNLLETRKLTEWLNQMPKDKLKVVVNNAGCAWYGLHEEIRAEAISAMIRTNLEVPELISSRLIRQLRKNQGYLINVSSVTALSSAAHAAAYGSSKAGLLHFSRTMFEENRKYGVKVTCIMPDLTDTALYRDADFTVAQDRDNTLQSKDIAEAVRWILHLPEGVTIPEIVIRPQKNKIRKK